MWKVPSASLKELIFPNKQLVKTTILNLDEVASRDSLMSTCPLLSFAIPTRANVLLFRKGARFMLLAVLKCFSLKVGDPNPSLSVRW